MARAIDGDALKHNLENAKENAERAGKQIYSEIFNTFIDWVERMPTLTQPNEPLTWEELKEMAGEPVYIVEPKKAISSWMLIDVVDEKSMWCVVGFGSSYRNFYKTYGKTWIAYRRPPEGEEEI